MPSKSIVTLVPAAAFHDDRLVNVVTCAWAGRLAATRETATTTDRNVRISASTGI
jgi:hypothetical protein